MAKHNRAMESVLQWGRNLIVAEGRDEGNCEHLGMFASMGPQLDSCGRRSVAEQQRSIPSGFNGAAT